MNDPMWAQRQPPQQDADVVDVWDGRPCTVADVTALRLHLRAGLSPPGGSGVADAGDVDRLLLAFEELASNGLRHGQAPVRVVVTTTTRGWLVDVSDTAADLPPAPAVGRDAAEGGLGLYLVARLSAAHGWYVQDGCKHVWSLIDFAQPSASAVSRPSPRRATSGQRSAR
jgi:anti-sigma regulatory factor (Ser/Thr protein kinase)